MLRTSSVFGVQRSVIDFRSLLGYDNVTFTYVKELTDYWGHKPNSGNYFVSNLEEERLCECSASNLHSEGPCFESRRQIS
jgi:hypothetical protein